MNQNDWGLFAGEFHSSWCSGYSHSQDGATLQLQQLPAALQLHHDRHFCGPASEDFAGQRPDRQLPARWPVAVRRQLFGREHIQGKWIAYHHTATATAPAVLDLNLPLTFSATATCPSMLPPRPDSIQVAVNNIEMPGTVQVLGSGYTMKIKPSSPIASRSARPVVDHRQHHEHHL